MILKQLYPGDEFITPGGRHCVLCTGDRTFTSTGHDHRKTALVMRLDDYTIHVYPWGMRVVKVEPRYTRILR